MIGSFRFRSRTQNAVMVDMHWNGDSRRASVSFPAEIGTEIALAQMPSGDDMSLESALGYAIFVGLRQQLPVRLCGDPSVWNDMWGTLDMVN